MFTGYVCNPNRIESQRAGFLFDCRGDGYGLHVRSMLGGTIEADTEVSGTSDRFAPVARADNIRLPIGLRFIKPTLQSAAF